MSVFSFKCILEQDKTEEVLAVVKYMDAEPKAYKQVLNLLFLPSYVYLLYFLQPV